MVVVWLYAGHNLQIAIDKISTHRSDINTNDKKLHRILYDLEIKDHGHLFHLYLALSRKKFGIECAA